MPTIAQSVVQRFKVARISDLQDESDQIDDVRELQDYLREDAELVGALLKQGATFIPICVSIVEPLRTPRLKDRVREMEFKVGLAPQLLKMLGHAIPLARRAAEKRDAMLQQVAKKKVELGISPRIPALVALVKNLPDVKALQQSADKAGYVHTRLQNWVYEDWTLDGFVGEEAGIWEELKDLDPVAALEDLTGAKGPYGFLNFLEDEESLESRLDELVSEME